MFLVFLLKSFAIAVLMLLLFFAFIFFIGAVVPGANLKINNRPALPHERTLVALVGGVSTALILAIMYGIYSL